MFQPHTNTSCPCPSAASRPRRLWKAPTTRAVSPSACCAVTAALSAGGNWTRATRAGGTSGTRLEVDDDLTGDVRLDLLQHGRVVGPGMVITTISAALAASALLAPRPRRPGRPRARRRLRSFSAVRDPRMTGHPAFANRRASPEPSAPVPPMMASVCFVSLTIVSSRLPGRRLEKSARPRSAFVSRAAYRRAAHGLGHRSGCRGDRNA